MKRILLTGLFLMVFAVVITGAEASSYILDSGDQLVIMVRGVSELQDVPVIVREDGMFSFPYAGEVMAKGKTIPELESILSAGLSSYLKNPSVQVLLKEERGLRVGIFGEVNNPGNLKVPADSNIISVLAFAGGPNLDNAKLMGVKIYHKDGSFDRVNLRGILNNPETADEYPIRDGDVIFVPKKFFSWELQTILQILSVVSITIGIREALKD